MSGRVRLASIVLGVEHVERAAAFWSAVLDYEVIPFDDSENDFTVLRPRDLVGTRVALQRSETPVQERPRVHLDLVVDNASDQADEIDRLCGLGATTVDWTYGSDTDFVVLADPDGNRFCVVNAQLARPPAATQPAE